MKIAQTLVVGGNLTLSRGGIWGDAWFAARGAEGHINPLDEHYLCEQR